jgi:VWFA-related protein
MLDMSYSTTFKIADIQAAAIEFIDQLRPQDKVMVVSFDQDVHVLCDPTADRQQVYRAIKTTRISTGTSIYEAVDLVMNRVLRPVQGRKAIILFTDGVDTTSRRTNDWQNLSDAMELDALIYPIRYDTFADVQRMKNSTTIPSPPPITVPNDSPNPVAIIRQTMSTPSARGTTEAEYRRAEEYLDQLSIRTGGRMYQASTLGNLADAYSKIASELREFYSIGYYPHNERVAGDPFHIKVKVDEEGLVVRTREGFLRPNKK